MKDVKGKAGEPISRLTPLVRPDEKFASDAVAKSLPFTVGHYVVGMPWRQDRPSLPDNYSMALCRLQCTEKKLKRSPELGNPTKQCCRPTKRRDTSTRSHMKRSSLIKFGTSPISQS